MKTSETICQHCEALLPAASPGGVCPACLMGEAMDSLETIPGCTGSALPDSDSPRFTSPDPLEGTSLGPGGRYKILQCLGEGGFGTVYMAEQIIPVRRRVAVKILKAGMDTRQVVARFEAERQALAMMDHPSIAKVLDGGETELGRPYFVMELVRGTPITTFCDREKFDPKARLHLFLDVCSAVQHAHQKGIIHRDLKPGNILVTLEDGAEPVPKVIDFGVAKAMESNLTDKTLFTRFEQMIGTPAYMSPEQAGSEASANDIDTRADIYALGVLLYELLTGTTPFETTSLHEAAFDEVRRILREEEAVRPSARLSGIELDRRTTIARDRGTEAGGLGKLLRGDLDWIVMKAIEKDRRRRYATANALALDIERHIACEPVSAGPPTLRYRVGKYLRRHRVGVGIASVLLASLVGGLALAGMGFAEAKKKSAIANIAEAQLEVDAATLRRINETLLKELFRQLRGQQEPGSPPELVRHTLLRVARLLEAQDDSRPGLDQVAVLIEEHLAEANLSAAAEANVRADLGDLFLATGLPDRAHQWLLPSAERLAVEDGIHAATEHAAARMLMEALIEDGKLITARGIVAHLEESDPARLPPGEVAKISSNLFGRCALDAAGRNGRRSAWEAAQRHYHAAYQTAPELFSAGDLLNHAVCCLLAGDRDSYESVSIGSLERYANSENARELATSTLTYLLGTRKRDPVRLSRALAMAKKVYHVRRHFFWDALSLALAECLLENDDEARALFAESEKNASGGNCATIAAAFLSIQAAQRGELALSAEHLARAQANQKRHLAMVPGEHDLGHEWFDLGVARIALRQAAEMIEQARPNVEGTPSITKRTLSHPAP